ncbi:MAG: DEAD/DEAH box helicase [Bacillota bacterium]
MHPLELVEGIKSDPAYLGQIVSVQRLPATEPKFGVLDPPLPPALQAILEREGIRELYEHQVKAVQLARAGKNFVVSTPTASGKSLAYNLPVLERLYQDPKKTALYIFPIKALAHDQLGKLKRYDTPFAITAYDGDTPSQNRASLRTGNIILTNPDMLHLGMLPYHLSWQRFFAGLVFVIIDELHYYRGILGVHMGHVMRRLRRICAYYGASPVFILCSGTISNPGDYGKKITGLFLEEVAGENVPGGEKYLVFWNPYAGRKKEPAGRSRYLEDAVLVARHLFQAGMRSIIFTKSRQLAEWLWIFLRDQVGEAGADKIKTYRGGYLPSKRRETEKALFGGYLQGVISTNALELGVDIGALDAGIIVGFPGAAASFWQQAGRVGRGGVPSVVVYVSTNDLLDLYYLRHSGDIMARSYGDLYVDIDNPYVLLDHVLCAAFELPIEQGDFRIWGPMFAGLVDFLVGEGDLTFNGHSGQWYFNGAGYPAERVNLRSANHERYVLAKEDGEVVGTLDGGGAFSRIHPGALYLHEGEAYEVTRLDLVKKIASLRPAEAGYFTETSEKITVEITAVHNERKIGPAGAFLGEVNVVTQVTGFRKRTAREGHVIGYETLDLPEEILSTVAIWLQIPDMTSDAVKKAGLDLHGGLHGTEHVLIGLMPLLTVCDRRDLAGTSMVFHNQARGPAVFIFDAAQGGIGLAEKAWEKLDELVRKAYETVLACPCEEGCPSCIQSPKCGNFNQPLDKAAVAEILKAIATG